ncbi:MAG TPA: ATP-binding protein [Gemmatimonadaceae bacterium]|jgi:hypothetical protein
MDATRLNALLYESEGTTLDFKREQYRFVRGTDDDKAELLKDLLAFANSWRREDAYILVGVLEATGHAEVVGVSEHPDDAQLQQFVNSKTSRPLLFSYEIVDHSGLKVGVYRIPQQDRPIYLKRDFAALKRNLVYLRRGSSTAIADPNEVAQMGAADARADRAAPRLSLSWIRRGTAEPIGPIAESKSEVLTKPNPASLPLVRRSALDIAFKNDRYYVELADYVCQQKLVSGLLLAVANQSAVSADDVMVQISIAHAPGLLILDRTQLIERPRYQGLITIHETLARHRLPSPDVVVERLNESAKITASFGHIRPGSTGVTRDALFVGGASPTEVVMLAIVSARDLLPVEVELAIELDTTHRAMSADDLLPFVREDIHD